MKRYFIKSQIIVFCLILMGINAKSQNLLTILPVNKTTNKIEYTDVVKVEGTSKELYTRGLTWINSFFKHAAEVTKVRDENNGIISGTHTMRIMNKLADSSEVFFGLVQYDFKFEFKDGRYKYTINDFASKEMSKQPIEKWLNPKDPSYTTNTPYHLKQIDKYIKDLVASMKKGLEPKAVIKDEW